MYKEIQAYLGESWTKFQSLFSSELKSDLALLNSVNEYLFTHGGKQLRPMLTLLCARAVSGRDNDNVIRCAAAVEMLHTATLLHDDVADSALERRGAPNIVALYSPDTSVLIGDFWLSRAIDLIVSHCEKRVVHSFSKCLQHLAEGEMLQIEKAANLDAKEKDYFKIIYCKTVSLFETAVLSAAYCLEASETQVGALREYALGLGNAFQIMDDIFDYSPQLNVGKPVGTDILEKKLTLPFFGMMNNAPRKVVDGFFERMKHIGEDETSDAALSADAIVAIQKYGGIEYAKLRLRQEIDEAVEALSPLHESEAKQYLITIADAMATRTR